MANDTHGEKGKPWIGFDLDGTLAEYNGWKGIDHIGKPIQRMCELVKKFHSDGRAVKILTARVAPRKGDGTPAEARQHIEKWCEEHLGFVPPITHEKDSLMEYLYDDRVVQVMPNTGIPIEAAAEELLQGKRGDQAKALAAYLAKKKDA